MISLPKATGGRCRRSFVAAGLLGRRAVGAVGATAALVAPLADPRRLAGPAAQIVELRPPDPAAAQHLDTGDLRAVQREDALDPLAVADLAHREGRVDAAVLARDADALERLHALARALDHLHVDPDRVAGREIGNRAIGRELRDLFLLELLDHVHGKPHWSSARWIASRARPRVPPARWRA